MKQKHDCCYVRNQTKNGKYLSRIECGKCTRQFQTMRKFSEHKKDHELGILTTCPHCPKAFSSPNQLNRHNSEDHANAGCKCELCPETFINKLQLTNHMKRKHGYCYVRYQTKIGRYISKIECEKCTRQFQTMWIFSEHKKHHEQGLLTTCPHCPKAFSSKKQLKWHTNKDHKGGLAEYVCTFCTFTFGSQTALSEHENQAHNKGMIQVIAPENHTSSDQTTQIADEVMADQIHQR